MRSWTTHTARLLPELLTLTWWARSPMVRQIMHSQHDSIAIAYIPLLARIAVQASISRLHESWAIRKQWHRPALETGWPFNHMGILYSWCDMQDVGALVGLARRRCTDSKAGVHKAAVQLLEALLLLRASGAGAADVILPSEPDLEAIQHAAADPMVPYFHQLRHDLSATRMIPVNRVFHTARSCKAVRYASWLSYPGSVLACKSHLLGS